MIAKPCFKVGNKSVAEISFFIREVSATTDVIPIVTITPVQIKV